MRQNVWIYCSLYSLWKEPISGSYGLPISVRHLQIINQFSTYSRASLWMKSYPRIASFMKQVADTYFYSAFVAHQRRHYVPPLCQLSTGFCLIVLPACKYDEIPSFRPRDVSNTSSYSKGCVTVAKIPKSYEVPLLLESLIVNSLILTNWLAKMEEQLVTAAGIWRVVG